tara:strand:+ start:1494 stop:1826 length:333 start_codon:yes stop_codon:yes gene_type:complete
MEFDQIAKILIDNKDKNFVKRILTPEEYSTLKNKDGSFSTHSMAWSNDEDTSYVYPTVVEDENGKLKRLSDKDAYDYAIEHNEYIQFKNPDDADSFSKDYKQYWNKETKP